MPSNSFKLISLFILISFFFNFNFSVTKAQDPTFIYQNCSSNRTTANSAYQLDLKILLSSLSSNATANNELYNNTVTGRNPSDTVYGLFMCRGDVSAQLCGQCVENATEKLSSDSECSLSKEAVIWYDECMVRYSNTSFFSTVHTRPAVYLLNTANISNQASFMPLLADAMNKTADEAASGGDRLYATNQTNLSGFQTLYTLTQCTPDLSPEDCRICLRQAIGDLPYCCEGKQGGRVLFPSCNIRYELYPFYRLPDVAPGGLVPETNYLQKDSEYSQDPGYLNSSCSTATTTNSAFQLNLRNLLSNLSSNATNGKDFLMTDASEIVFGLFMCRFDISPLLCGKCVQNATHQIDSRCRSSREAIIWYNHCFLRYSYQSFSSIVDTDPKFEMLNITTSNSSYINTENTTTLSNTLAEAARQTGDSVERYQTKSLRLNDYQMLYILAQCTRDLSSEGCRGCLNDVIGSAIPWSRLGSVGGRVLYPSCNMRFELFQFYDLQPPEAATPPTDDLGHSLLNISKDLEHSPYFKQFKDDATQVNQRCCLIPNAFENMLVWMSTSFRY